jgi:cellulose synthase (UDP-forming)
VGSYQNASFPARQRSKEGNLRYFYETYGYVQYDFVAQFDADHAPTTEYLRNIIQPFIDPDVGYVAAPSICNTNANESWACRARLYAEAPLHGALQAGYNGGWAPNPIGSHYAVRTRALASLVHRSRRSVRAVGGLGPELAEDHSTGLAMNANGWKGAFAMDAIAHGEGPGSLADALIQEFQWARSLINVLLRWTPGYWRGLTPRLKLQYAFAQLWYPLFGLHMLAAYALPPLALITKTPWVSVDYVEFLAYAGPLVVACVLPIMWLKRHRFLRPTEGKTTSWEGALFLLVRWPWVLYACGQAVADLIRRKEFQFRVTPKGSSGGVPLTIKLLLPYLSIAVIEAGTAILIAQPGRAKGYYYLALLNSVTYVVVALAVIVLHFRENRTHARNPFKLVLPPSLAAAAVTIVAAGAILLRGQVALTLFDPVEVRATIGSVLPAGLENGEALSRVPGPWQANPKAETAGNLNTPRPSDRTVAALFALPAGQAIRSAEQPPDQAAVALADGIGQDRRLLVGAYDPHHELSAAPMDIEHWFVHQNDPGLLARDLDQALRSQRLPAITIEPYPNADELAPILDLVAQGKKDDELRRLANVVAKNPGQTVMMRWGHEMELSGSYPWATDRPDLYRAAYRRVVALFREQGATNVRWLWSPAGNEGAEAYYPGDDVVDCVGVTVLADSGWDKMFGLPGQSFSELFRPRYKLASSFGKPVIIAELGVSGGPDREKQWLADAAQSVDQFPLLRAVMYFNEVNPQTKASPTRPDWRVQLDGFKSFVEELAPATHS